MQQCGAPPCPRIYALRIYSKNKLKNLNRELPVKVFDQENRKPIKETGHYLCRLLGGTMFNRNSAAGNKKITRFISTEIELYSDARHQKLLHCRIIPVAYKFPIYHIPPVGNIIGSFILIHQVISMFPYI